MSRLLGPGAALLLLLLLGLAKLKIVHDQSQMALQQQVQAPRPPPSQIPSGLDGRALNPNIRHERNPPLQPPAVPQ